MMSQKFSRWVVFGVVLAVLAFAVLASHGGNISAVLKAPTIVAPLHQANVSGTVTLNASVDIAYNGSRMVNVTFRWQNSTGNYVLNTTVQNSTDNQTIFQNLTFSTLLLADGRYNLTILATNGSHASNMSSILNLTNVSILVDNTPPNVSDISVTNASNYSINANNITFSARIIDRVDISVPSGMAYVYFWFDNGTGQDFNVSGVNSSGTWSISYNVSALAEQRQGVRIQSNDTAGAINSTVINFTVDFTSPNVTLNYWGVPSHINGSTPNSNNFTGTSNNITFNASVFDNLTEVSTVYFWFDNGTGNDINVTGRNDSGAWIVSYNVSSLIDGKQGVRIMANDTVNNMNNTAVFNFTVDYTTPNITFESLYNTTNVTFTNGTIFINITVLDTVGARNVSFWVVNGTNGSTDGSQVVIQSTPLSNNSGGNHWNASIPVGILTNGNYSLRFNVTDFNGNSNASQRIVFGFDNRSPQFTSYTCQDVTQGGRQNCNCVVVDNSQNFSGAFNMTESSVDTTVAGATSSTCVVFDLAGNRNRTTAAFTVTAVTSSSSSSGGGSSGGSGGGVAAGVGGQFEKVVWTSINAGETAIVPVDNGVIGVTEVTFGVASTSYGAWVQVSKLSSLPSTVPSFDRSAYRLIEITKSTTLKDKDLKDRVIDFKVEKSWLSSNSLQASDVAMFRFADSKWNELPTTQGEDDGTYVHYTATTPGFSYFVIGQRATVQAAPSAPATEPAPTEEAVAGEEATGGAGAEAGKSGLPTWLWIAIVVVVILGIFLLAWTQQRK